LEFDQYLLFFVIIERKLRSPSPKILKSAVNNKPKSRDAVTLSTKFQQE
jgi:hypothetical protein